MLSPQIIVYCYGIGKGRNLFTLEVESQQTKVVLGNSVFFYILKLVK